MIMLLVLDAGGIGARRAKEISIKVRQVVVVALDTLDQLAAAESAAAAGACAALSANDGRGRRVFAGLAGGRNVWAGANPVGQVDQVDAGAGAARHRPDRAPYVLDLVCALAVELEASLFPGRWVRGCARLVLHQDLASWCRASGCVTTAGAAYVVNSYIVSQMVWKVKSIW
jgi:hypothetical protein